MRRPVLALVLAASALAPSAAAAAPPWSPPQTLSSPHLFVDVPTVGFAGNGDGLATWRTQDGIGDQATGSVDGAALAHGAATFGAESTLAAGPRPSLVSPPVFYGRGGRALVATQRPVSSDPAEQRVRLAAVFGRVPRFFAPHTIAVQRGLRGAQLAADSSGDAAIAWFQDRGVTTDRVYVSLRRIGGQFGPPVELGRGRIRSVSVAVSPRGDVLVAWDARGVVRARVKPRSRSRFGPTDTIASEPTFFATLHTAIAPNGRAFVAWGAQFRSEGGSTGPVFYEVAVRPSGAARFRAAQLLERQPETQMQMGLDLALDAVGHATVAWTGWDGAHYRVRAAATDPRLVFGAPQDVSPPGADAFEGALAAAPDGRRLVAWTTGSVEGTGGALLAALAPRAGPFGAPETVSPGLEARIPAAAYDGRGDRWALVWSNRPAGSNVPLADVRTFAQAALRPAS